VSMKKHEDPAVLFEQLAEIEVTYAGTTITINEQDWIEVVLATAAEKYHAVLTSEQCAKGASLTMDDLEDAMHQLWRQGGGSQTKHTSDDGGEMVLDAFGGTNYNCQEMGHRANQCPNKTGPNNGNRSEGGNTRGELSETCNHCGKIRYKKSSCWKLDENKNKRPKNFPRGNTEHANAAISAEDGEDGNTPEFLMCALCYDEEEGSTATDYDVHVFNGIEEETIEFVNENDE
jgi:hypothetical protein